MPLPPNFKQLFISFPHHSFAPLDFLDDSFHIKVSKFGPWCSGQLYRPRREKLKQSPDEMQLLVLQKHIHRLLCQREFSPCTCSVRPLFWSYPYEACLLFRSLRHRHGRNHSAGRRLQGWSGEATCPAKKKKHSISKSSHKATKTTSESHRLYL